MKNIIERNRRRVIKAKLFEMEYKTNSHYSVVKLPDGTVTTIRLTEEIISKALVKLFEKPIYASYKQGDADKYIAEHYSACTTRRLDKLSNLGTGFMNALIENLVVQAFSQQGN